MSVNVIYSCDGCDSHSEPIRLSRQFQSISGRGYGFGSYEYDQPKDKAPDGWVAYDPYTGCCYCPDCWSKLSAEIEEDRRKEGRR